MGSWIADFGKWFTITVKAERGAEMHSEVKTNTPDLADGNTLCMYSPNVN